VTIINSKKSRSKIDIYNIRRATPLEYVNINVLNLGSLDDYPSDPIYDELLAKYYKGKICIGCTRISISRITPGFLKRVSERDFEYIKDPIGEDAIVGIARKILSGSRLPVMIYKNEMSDETDFFCPDDVAVLEAYRALGIRKVPVALLAPRDVELEESAIYVSNIETPDGYQEYIAQAVSANFTKVGTYFGNQSSVKISDVTWFLINEIGIRKQRLQKFHLSNSQLHYHHTLSSILHRLEQIIQSIQLLVESNFYHQALALLRVMYELVLSFYIDWIAPELIGPWLQRAAIYTKQEWSKEVRAYFEQKDADLWNKSTVDIVKKSYNRSYDLASRVSEKARLNPLGLWHKDLYKYLSRIAHQDFTIAAEYANTLDQKVRSQDEDEKDLQTIIKYMDLFTAQVLEKLDYEIGFTQE